MQPDKAFFKLLEDFEGFSSCPYLDSGGVPTIGIGTIRYPNGIKVTMKDKCITWDQAADLVNKEIGSYVTAINSQLPNLSQNKFNALLSLAYNIGIDGFVKSSVVRRAKKDLNDPTIRNAFMMWVKDNGKVVHGLEVRRKKEADLYFK